MVRFLETYVGLEHPQIEEPWFSQQYNEEVLPQVLSL